MDRRGDTYPRFDIWDRIEHAILLVSFAVLAITGLPQKYPDTMWGETLIRAMGGIEWVRVFHHAAAILLMLEVIYHSVAVAYKVLVRRVELTMLPMWQDVRDGIQALAFNLGAAKSRPRMGRYTFGEKLEYWAVVWGTLVMVVTGFVLWNPIAATKFLPGQLVPAAKAAHSGEALLAILSIITWHLYNVHIRQFNRSMFTGRISRHEMEEEHPLELEQMEGKRIRWRPDPEAERRRKWVFFPIAAVTSAVLLAALYVFVTFEETAITTVPRQEIETFVPASSGEEP
jgi:formate dehydrogenase gamma subunit